MSIQNGSGAVPDLYCVEEIQKLLEVVFFTGWLKDENPVSLLLIGPSGTGKSKLICAKESPCFLRTDSISSNGLFDIAQRDHANTLKFLLIPDLNGTLSRRPTTVEATLANLLSFTSDGTVRVDDGRGEKICKHRPIGLITAATTEIYKKNAKRWYNLGLRRRILPVFYRYSPATLQKLQRLVSQNKIHSSIPDGAKFNEKMEKQEPISVSIPDKFEIEIMMMSTALATFMGKDAVTDRIHKRTYWESKEVVPISPQITLKNLARAHALNAERRAVNQSDFDFLGSFLGFCDPENPRQI